MATKFYFPSTGSPAVSPAINAGGEWEHASTNRRPMSTASAGSAMANLQYTADASDHLVNADAMVVQFTSTEQLVAQTIAAQTLRAVILCLESNNSNNLFLTLKVFVVSADGTTVRGTLAAITRASTELATSQTSRTWSVTTSALGVLDGDRIVVEMGVGGTPSASGGTQGHNSTFRLGDGAASGDQPFDEVGTTDRNGWIEFANNLSFLSPPSSARRVFTVI